VNAIRIPVAGTELGARHFPGQGEAFEGPAGRPCVVMAHGLGATRDSGLDGFAEGLSQAGLDVLAFDYRGFGESGGEPRQLVSIRAQLDDYRAAVAHARALPGVDPERIVVWGVSFAGGHVFVVAAADPAVAAAIAVTPATDGTAALSAGVRRDGPAYALRLTALGLRDLVAALRGRAPVLAPLAGAPGEVAALTAPGALEAYRGIAGPTWRNELAARLFLQVASYRPVRHAERIRCPMLVQIADADQSAPPLAAMRAAELARAEVRHYPCDHFDVFPGRRWFEHAVSHQVDFLRRHLGGSARAETAPAAAAHS
jgi:fermentation-respiration switch protein FrsA (DUF1100 family)